MKRLESSHGITLIALVVTVVVTLIIFGITIDIAIGDNGLLEEAGKVENNAIQSQTEAEELMNQLDIQGINAEADGAVKSNDDKTAPVVSIKECTKLTSTSFKVSVVVTDTGSGIYSIEYSKDGGTNYEEDLTGKVAKSHVFTSVTSGTYNIKVKVTDNSDNTSYATASITL